MKPSREAILDRVRSALRLPAHRPVAPTGDPVFPAVTNPAQRFREEFAALRGELLDSVADLKAFLAGFPATVTDGSELVEQTVGAGNATVRQAELGVTGCDCLVAQTGSVIVSTHGTHSRALSVLPPVHLVIARRDQLLPDLATALSFLRTHYAGNWPSSLSVISGPSRTADIEKILVMGAHGPKRLALYFL